MNSDHLDIFIFEAKRLSYSRGAEIIRPNRCHYSPNRFGQIQRTVSIKKLKFNFDDGPRKWNLQKIKIIGMGRSFLLGLHRRTVTRLWDLNFYLFSMFVVCISTGFSHGMIHWNNKTVMNEGCWMYYMKVELEKLKRNSVLNTKTQAENI